MWWRGSVCLVVVTCLVLTSAAAAAAAAGHTRVLGSSLAFFGSTNSTGNSGSNIPGQQNQSDLNYDSGNSSTNSDYGNSSRASSRNLRRPHARRLLHDGDHPRDGEESLLRRIFRSTGIRAVEETFNVTGESPTTNDSKGVSESDKWRCLLEWLKVHEKSTKDQRTCEREEGEDVESEVQEKVLNECVPLLLLVIPSLCDGGESCVNVTEASLESLIHRYFLWERKKKRREQANDAVIYIVVVLAFYSFGIVFMMANFVRQEQRELEETKMYKQYVKLARDRWLTTRGNLANKLALQALNTFNAVPQTTDVNKVTFV